MSNLIKYHFGKLLLCWLYREKTALWYVDPNNQEIKYSYEEISLASQKAANAIQGLGAKRSICILPKVSTNSVIPSNSS